jgi:hypothetical protein
MSVKTNIDLINTWDEGVQPVIAAFSVTNAIVLFIVFYFSRKHYFSALQTQPRA